MTRLNPNQTRSPMIPVARRPRARHTGRLAPWLILAVLILNLLAFLAFGADPRDFQLATYADWDKLQHFVLFAGLSLAIGLARPRWIGLGLVAMGLVLVGLGDEILQAYTPGRTADYADFLMDEVGVFAAIGLLELHRHRSVRVRRT